MHEANLIEGFMRSFVGIKCYITSAYFSDMAKIIVRRDEN